MTLVQTRNYTRPCNYRMLKEFPNYAEFAQEASLIYEVFCKTDSGIADSFARSMFHKKHDLPISLPGRIGPDQIRCICHGIYRNEQILQIASDLVDERFVEFLDRHNIEKFRVTEAWNVEYNDKEGQAEARAKAEDFLAENGWFRKDDDWRGPYYEKA